MSVLYARIKQLTEEKGMSIREVEVAAGLSNNSIGRWNKSMPSVDKLASVAKVLHVSTDYLIGVTNYKTISEEFDSRYNKDGCMKQRVKDIEAIDTIAAHLEDKQITDEKVKALTQYMDLLFDKKK